MFDPLSPKIPPPRVFCGGAENDSRSSCNHYRFRPRSRERYCRKALPPGYGVVVSDLNDEVLNETYAEFKDKNFEISSLVADVTKPEDHEALIKHAVDTFGKVDVYINNAGVEGEVEEIEKINAKNMDFVFDVNVKGVLFGIQAAAKQMRKQGHGGTII